MLVYLSTVGHYLLRETEPRGTDNVQGQISKHIFAPNGGYGVYYPDPSNIFSQHARFENWEISSDITEF